MENHQIISIDSDNRLNSSDSPSNFTYKINYKGVIDRVCLSFASIPKSYYLIQSGKNTITLTENGTPRTITIVPGNYTFTTFKTALQTLMNTGGLYTYTVVATVSAGKYTITASSSNPIIMTFPTSSTLYKQLGFSYNSSNNFTATILTSSYVCQFTALSAIYVRSDIVNGDDQGSQNLAIIPVVNQPDMTYIVSETHNPLQYGRESNANGSRVFRFTLYDLDDNILDLQGCGSVNFELILWKHSNLDRLMETYFKTELLKSLEKIRTNNIE